MRVYTGTPAAVRVTARRGNPNRYGRSSELWTNNPWSRVPAGVVTRLDDVYTPAADWDDLDLDLVDHAPLRPVLRQLAGEWDDLAEMNVALGDYRAEHPEPVERPDAGKPNPRKVGGGRKGGKAARGRKKSHPRPKPRSKPPRPFDRPLGPETRPSRGALPVETRTMIAEWVQVERQIRPLFPGTDDEWEVWFARVRKSFDWRKASVNGGRVKWAMFQLRRSA